MDLISYDGEFSYLIEKLIYAPEQLTFIKNFQDLSNIYDEIINNNDRIVTEISEILRKKSNEESYRCEKFENGHASTLYCIEECESTDDCYSEIWEDLEEYVRRYLDTDVIAELVFNYLIDKDITVVVKEYKDSPFILSIVALYADPEHFISSKFSSADCIYINYPLISLFLNNDNNKNIIEFGKNTFILIPKE